MDKGVSLLEEGGCDKRREEAREQGGREARNRSGMAGRQLEGAWKGLQKFVDVTKRGR